MTFLHHATIYVSSGALPQSVTTAGVYEKMIGFEAEGPSFGDLVPVAASNKITLIETGKYLVFLSLSIGGTVNAEVDAEVRWNGTSQPQVSFIRKVGPAGSIVPCFAQGIIDANEPNKDLEIWFTSGSNGDQIELKRGQLTSIWISTTQVI